MSSEDAEKHYHPQCQFLLFLADYNEQEGGE
jgi:hypothetical protein